MYIATAAQQKAADLYTIQKMGVPSLVLMETAANRLMDACPDATRVIIFCGGGNNGGDGFCLGRLLAQKNKDVTLVRLYAPEKMSPDAQTEYALALRFGVSVISLEEASALCGADLVIDAMLGTGQFGAPKGKIAEAVTLYNQMSGIKLAVDIPTGVNCDTGEVYIPAAKADLTVCIGSLKYGVLVGEGQQIAGKVLLKEIGLPKEAMDAAGICGTLADAAWAKAHLPVRALDAHKYSCGNLLIFSGSVGMTGAPTLAAQGALYSGAGLVTVAVPSCISNIISVKLTEPLILPLSEEGDTFSSDAGRMALEHMTKTDAALIGPGIRHTPSSAKAMQDFIEKASCALVIDAGALPFTESRPDEKRSTTVITPHRGEAARILDCTVQEINADPVKAAQMLAKKTGCVSVLKGHPTITATPDGKLYVNTTGNPGMATGGTGDVLAGVITSLIGQGIKAAHAAVLGVYLHGLAGDIAAKQKGEHGLCATDVAKALPIAISITQGKNVSV